VACALWNSGRFFYTPGLVQVETSPRRRSKQQCQMRPTISFLPRCAGSTAIRGGHST
jgi:hypothetical protein